MLKCARIVTSQLIHYTAGSAKAHVVHDVVGCDQYSARYTIPASLSPFRHYGKHYECIDIYNTRQRDDSASVDAALRPLLHVNEVLRSKSVLSMDGPTQFNSWLELKNYLKEWADVNYHPLHIRSSHKIEQGMINISFRNIRHMI